jgi:hypothetical protein
MAGKWWLVSLLVTAVGAIDPLAIVEPTVALSAADRLRLDRGELVSRVLPAHHGQVAVFAATRIDVDPDTLIAAARDITDLKKSSLVVAIGRFSDPPRLSDLDALTLDAHDRDVLAACEPRRCSFKLAAVEIEAIRQGRDGDVDGDRITMALRRVMLQRVEAYLSAGLAALPPITNRSKPWQLHDVLAAAHAESPRLLQSPPLSSWIQDEPASDSLESLIYWSKELFGSGKPVILITHVAIHRPAPGVAVVVGKQVFASRYLTGGLSMTALTTAAGGQHYLVYLNRSTVDLLGGLFGGIRRSMLESRLSGKMPELIARLRDRLERSRHVSRPDSLRHH